MTDSSSQSAREIVTKMFSADDTIFEDENGAKSNFDEDVEMFPTKNLNLSLGNGGGENFPGKNLKFQVEVERRSPPSLRLSREPTEEEEQTQKVAYESGKFFCFFALVCTPDDTAPILKRQRKLYFEGHLGLQN